MNKISLMDMYSSIIEDCWDVPFANSKFQSFAFILANQITPERAYRAITVHLSSKLKEALNFNVMKLKLETTREKMVSDIEQASGKEKEILELELELFDIDRRMQNKLERDILSEIEYLHSLKSMFPKYTGDQFESAEEKYFIERGKRESLGITGGKESIVNIVHDKAAFQEVFNQQSLDYESFKFLTDKMTNLLSLQVGEEGAQAKIGVANVHS